MTEIAEKTQTRQEQNVNILHKDGAFVMSEVMALYFDKDAIRTTPEKVYRIDGNAGTRYYYTFDRDNFRPEYFISVTAFIHKTMPTPEQVIKWYGDLGYDKAEEYKRERGVYGTIIHIEFTEFLISKTCELEGLEMRVQAYLDLNNTPGNVVRICDELRKDILGFAQFCIDYDVKPLAIEQLLVSREYGFGGAIDLVCEMNECKYTEATPVSRRKRVRAILDYKGGKNGFYESHEVQLHAYKAMWEENFPDYPIDVVGNWSGSDWRKEPGYNYKTHTDKPSAQKLPFLIELARISELKPARTLKFFTGVIKYGEPLNSNYKVVELDEYITNLMLTKI